MFIRPCYRTKNGKRHAYWALVESYRTARGPRQRVVAYLGDVGEAKRRGTKRAAGGGAAPSLFEETAAEWVEVDVKRLRVERCLDFGGPWLGLQVLRRLELIDFLEEIMPAGREEIPWPLMAAVLVLCRLCRPSSELYIAEHLYKHTAVADLLGIPPRKINEQRLYRALDKVLFHREALQIFLKNRLGNLFDLEYDLPLYDMTSTYFQGQAKANPKARRGYSRDHRGDCKQICIALVVTKDGMPLGYETFAGNRADVTTVEEVVETMEQRYGRADRIWAMDRGMVSEENLAFLREGGRRYVVGTPKGMLRQFERELLKAELSEGCYLPRSNVTDWSGPELWRAYMQLTDAEEAFRIHKTDLRIRPIWHQKEERADAHVLVCFLAYVLWKTLEQMCRRAGLGDEPRRVLDELGRIKLVDVVLPTREGTEIRRRCVTRPDDHQAILLQQPGLVLPSNLPLTDEKPDAM